MDSKYLFYVTLVISIIVQIITGIIEVGVFFIKVPTMYSLIRQLLILELIVQFFEGTFYFWLAYNFAKISNVTPKRYIDWFITTPTMLITLILYLIYLNKRKENKTLFFFISGFEFHRFINF
jgi:bacteriorhodopsin